MKSIAAQLLFASLCAVAQAAPCPTDLPVLFVVQDKSGSMGEVPTSGCSNCPTKWESSKTAVTNLTTKFANRFDFGLEFYPASSTSCSTGTVVAPFPASPQDIHAKYTAAAPGGATPTAVSLTAAKNYLRSLNLGVKAYVLLITDGMPNCNANLDPDTCTWSMSGCDSWTCGGDSCLDDSATRTAAAAVYAAGFPVYVVGFGANAVGSNQAVLNAVAASGGTGSAYAATDQASLSTALDTIAANVANCCVNVCTQGASQCSANGEQIRCVFDAAQGCTAWTQAPCPAKSICTNGACLACNDQCTLNATRCSGSAAEKCVAGAGGCTVWSKVQDCGYGERCLNGACTTCKACNPGDARCAGAATRETCEADLLTGCADWKRTACDRGTSCAAGVCARCDGACAAGAKQCNGLVPATCAADAQGCTSWSNGTACTTYCSGGACGVCGTSCTAGATQCQGAKVATCGKDGNNCPIWTTRDCGPNTTCVNGACAACPQTCTLGAKGCSGTSITECKQQADGCFAMVPVQACAAGQVCTNGACITPCKDECALGAAQCGGQVPYACVKAPSGCTVWQAAAACASPKLCVAGICRDPCAGGEIETCSAGSICTVLPAGHVCIPEAKPDGGTPPILASPTGPDGGGKLDLTEDSPDASTRPAAATPEDGSAPQGVGCGCAASSASPLLALLPALLLPWSRRRRG